MTDPQNRKRAFYRVRYPELARPSIWLGIRHFPVTELSEHGLRLLAGSAELEVGQAVEATIRLYHGASREIQGQVNRLEPPEAVVTDVAGISFGDMMAEQRALIRDFPSFA